MAQRSLKKQIVESYNSATPNCIEQIKRACEGVEQKDQDIYMVRDNYKVNKILSQLVITAACLIILLTTGIVYLKVVNKENLSESPNSQIQQLAENTTEITNAIVGVQAAVIYLDINPSIEIKIDEDMKVIDCVAINEDAKIVIKDLDLKGLDFNIAVDSIVGSLTVNGYLKDDTDAILVSVNTKTDEIFENVNKSVNVVIKDKSLKCDIITQAVVHDSQIEQLAKEWHVSEGKVVFVEKIIDESLDYTEENVKELVQYPVKYLNDLLKAVHKKNDDIKKQESTQNTTVEAVIEDVIKDTEKVVDDSLNGADKIVEDSLNGTDKIINDSIKGVDKVVDDSIDLSEKIVDDTFDTTEKIITDVLGTETPINDILDDTQKIVDDTLNNVGKIFDKVIKKP